LSDARLLKFQLRTPLVVGPLLPTLGTRAHLWSLHAGTNTVIGQARALLGQLLDLGIQELFARRIQLQTTCTVGLRLHWASTGFTRSILISHLSHCLTRDQHTITHQIKFSGRIAY